MRESQHPRSGPIGGSRPVWCPGVEASEVVDEIVLHQPDQSRAFALNTSATLIWRLCDGQHTVHEMGTILASECGTPAAELVADVNRAVSEMLACGLLNLADQHLG